MNNQPALSIDGLFARYPGQDSYALENINWHAEQGQLHAIIGPNGAGKSTLLKSVMQLIPHQKGKIQFFGQALEKIRKKIAYVPQRSSVDWDFPVSVLDVATMGLYGQIGWLTPINNNHKAQGMEALEKLGIADLARRQIGNLSGGQQQRTFLARALAQQADLYLMDEPFAGVDVATEDKIIEVLNDLKKQGKTIIIVHHNLSTVERVFDQALLLKRQMITSGPVADVIKPDILRQAYDHHLSVAGNMLHG